MKGLVKYGNGDEYYGGFVDGKREEKNGRYLEQATRSEYRGEFWHDRKHGRGKGMIMQAQ